MQDSNEKTASHLGDLIHPSREEWISYLYGEGTKGSSVSLAAHLERCPPCQAQLAAWRATMKDLDAWKLPVSPGLLARARSAIFQPTLKWAAAAAIVLGLGFGVGRISSLALGEAATIRASLQEEFDRKIETTRAGLTEDIRRQQAEALNQVLAASASAKAELEGLVTELAKSAEEKRAMDGEAVAAALQQLDNKWAALHATLRKELETVALLTEDGFNDTQQKLYQLASFTQAPADK